MMKSTENAMRKKHSFLLTIVPAEEQQRSRISGRLESIATGDCYTFTNLYELQQLIEKEIHNRENEAASSIRASKPAPFSRPPAYPEHRPEDH